MISIIVPCYNQAKYMREALDSVLASTLSDWECIITPVRDSDYDRTSEYNTNMKHGHEDWDFWLSLLTPKDDVYKIPEVLFYYCKHGVSMISGTKEKLSVTNQQLVLNHLDVYKPYLGNLISWHNESLHYKGSFLALANSKTYQIGNIILYPFKLARSIFRKV